MKLLLSCIRGWEIRERVRSGEIKRVLYGGLPLHYHESICSTFLRIHEKLVMSTVSVYALNMLVTGKNKFKARPMNEMRKQPQLHSHRVFILRINESIIKTNPILIN